MGQKSAVDRMPEIFRKRVIEMLNNPAMTQQEIVVAINAEAGKRLFTKSSLNRFIQNIQKVTGMKRGFKAPTAQESLVRIAVALERIAFSLEKQYKKTS
jgi:hypothetical protein